MKYRMELYHIEIVNKISTQCNPIQMVYQPYKTITVDGYLIRGLFVVFSRMYTQPYTSYVRL